MGEHPLLAHLQGDAEVAAGLWDAQAAALFAYRALDESARLAVRRLLLVSDAVPFEDVKAWVSPGADAETRARHTAGLVALRRLRILEGRAGAVYLEPSFRASLVSALSSGSETADGGTVQPQSNGNAKRGRSVESCAGQLDAGGDAWWKTNVLLPMVRGEGSAALGALLGAAGLVEGSKPGRWSLGAAGFQFLLDERRAQLWALLLAWLRSGPREALGARLRLLMALGVAAPGAPVEPADVCATLGLSSCGRATALASALLGGAEERRGGFLVVETNYRVYAYTDCPLETATLGLFVRVRGRFANMVHGQITGPSVRAALARGISAAQIVAYLAGRLRGCVLPPVVRDQIHLWERDRSRLRALPGVLYGSFADDASHARAAAEAERTSGLLYVNRPKRLLVVSEECHAHMRVFLSR